MPISALGAMLLLARLIQCAPSAGLSAHWPPPRAPVPATTSSAPAAPATSHHAALRASSLAGILHGCLKTGTPYDGVTAWQHWLEDAALASKRHGCLRWLDPAPATTSEMARELGFPGLADC
jgi:hypothetical protein